MAHNGRATNGYIKRSWAIKRTLMMCPIGRSLKVPEVNFHEEFVRASWRTEVLSSWESCCKKLRKCEPGNSWSHLATPISTWSQPVTLWSHLVICGHTREIVPWLSRKPSLPRPTFSSTAWCTGTPSSRSPSSRSTSPPSSHTYTLGPRTTKGVLYMY